MFVRLYSGYPSEIRDVAMHGSSPKYISNLRGEADASQKSEVRSQKSEVRSQKSEVRGLDRYFAALPAMKYKCGSHLIRLAPFNERGRVERGAECCDAFRKFFPRPTHALLRFVGDDSAGHRHENSFLKKADRLAGAEERAESNRLNPAQKRPRESAFPRATALRM